MKEMIIYETFYGNTEKIAHAIGKGFHAGKSAVVYKAAEIKPELLNEVELLIVGSPTRGFRPTPAVLSLIDGLPANALSGVRVAAFDTRTIINDKVPGILKLFARLFGYAAEKISARLEKKGASLILPPEGFLVEGSEGPLVTDELKRAEKWGRQIRSVR